MSPDSEGMKKCHRNFCWHYNIFLESNTTVPAIDYYLWQRLYLPCQCYTSRWNCIWIHWSKGTAPTPPPPVLSMLKSAELRTPHHFSLRIITFLFCWRSPSPCSCFTLGPTACPALWILWQNRLSQHVPPSDTDLAASAGRLNALLRFEWWENAAKVLLPQRWL